MNTIPVHVLSETELGRLLVAADWRRDSREWRDIGNAARAELAKRENDKRIRERYLAERAHVKP